MSMQMHPGHTTRRRSHHGPKSFCVVLLTEQSVSQLLVRHFLSVAATGCPKLSSTSGSCRETQSIQRKCRTCSPLRAALYLKHINMWKLQLHFKHTNTDTSGLSNLKRLNFTLKRYIYIFFIFILFYLYF